MARKEKEIIWHKKKSKFLPASFEKARAVSAQERPASAAVSRRKQFADHLLKKIRTAVEQSSNNKFSL